MWSRHDFASLIEDVPFPVTVDWNVRPSALKYGHVNSLLAVIRALNDQKAVFFASSGTVISTLPVVPIKRKLTDKQKRNFTIVGHSTALPLLIVQVGNLLLEVYFNHHFFIQPNTSISQYFPSASVILRIRNYLKWNLVPSPGSWGSDIISLSYDWDGTFVLEASEFGLTGQVRHNFRGYKFIPTQDKFFLSRRRLPLNDKKMLRNNGFTNDIFASNVGECWPVLSREVARFIRDQRGRFDIGTTKQE